MYVCSVFGGAVFTDDLKFVFFFPITLSAVQSMDHSFDGISIKKEEGAYQRKSNGCNFQQILQSFRKGITNEPDTHCLFTLWLLLPAHCRETSGIIRIPSGLETPRALITEGNYLKKTPQIKSESLIGDRWQPQCKRSPEFLSEFRVSKSHELPPSCSVNLDGRFWWEQ